tara:strand:- start:136 stop:660 length:525 start_codon:yes stop_codon:yes gene_type:complete
MKNPNENYQLENVVEIVKKDEKWVFGSVKGTWDVYGARYRLCYVLDQDAPNEIHGLDEDKIPYCRFVREWVRKDHMLFPSFKSTVEVMKADTLKDKYIEAFNRNRPRHNYDDFAIQTWNKLLNFMSPILDTNPVLNSWDYHSDEDEWSEYESHKRRGDYGSNISNENSLSVIFE